MVDPARVEDLVHFYESLTPASIARMGDFYADHAHFKDPFNEVWSLAEIQGIFARMFHKVDAPRFAVTERIVAAHAVALTWTFEFSRRGSVWTIHGASVLRFAADGRVIHHRDYWDAAEELYDKLPVVGALMRWLKRKAG